jgi:hypothetical protein
MENTTIGRDGNQYHVINGLSVRVGSVAEAWAYQGRHLKSEADRTHSDITHPRGMTMYTYNGKPYYSREALRADITAEVATLDPEQWQDDPFDFDAWLSDSIATGSVTQEQEDL